MVKLSVHIIVIIVMRCDEFILLYSDLAEDVLDFKLD